MIARPRRSRRSGVRRLILGDLFKKRFGAAGIFWRVFRVAEAGADLLRIRNDAIYPGPRRPLLRGLHPAKAKTQATINKIDRMANVLKALRR